MNTLVPTKQAAERILVAFKSHPEEFDFVSTLAADELLQVPPHEAEVMFHLLECLSRIEAERDSWANKWQTLRQQTAELTHSGMINAIYPMTQLEVLPMTTDNIEENAPNNVVVVSSTGESRMVSVAEVLGPYHHRVVFEFEEQYSDAEGSGGSLQTFTLQVYNINNAEAVLAHVPRFPKLPEGFMLLFEDIRFRVLRAYGAKALLKLIAEKSWAKSRWSSDLQSTSLNSDKLVKRTLTMKVLEPDETMLILD
jgi:hypothetical protein